MPGFESQKIGDADSLASDLAGADLRIGDLELFVRAAAVIERQDVASLGEVADPPKPRRKKNAPLDPPTAPAPDAAPIPPAAGKSERIGCGVNTLRDAIKRLEDHFNLPREGLLQRPKKRRAKNGDSPLRLTEQGVHLYHISRKLLEPFYMLRAERRILEPEVLAIATHTSLEVNLLPKAIARFFATHDHDRVRVNVTTIENSHEGFDALRNQTASLLLDYVSRVHDDDNIDLCVSSCCFERVILFPQEPCQELAPQVRDKMKMLAARAPAGQVALSELEDVPLAYVEYRDLAEGTLLGSHRGRRINLGTNAAVVEFAMNGWAGLTIGWDPVLKEARDQGCAVVRLAPESDSAIKSAIAPLKALVAVRKVPQPTAATLAFREVLIDLLDNHVAKEELTKF